ncbi:MAG: hypothetical protein IJX80_08575 [Clostridia bacterium]|nr:hypothetical protein [Clostridia bacterium]
MENKEKEAGGEIVVQNRFLKWLDNFWYHYKWTVIVVAFFVTVFLVCFVQCTQSKQVDIPVVFAGAYAEPSEEQYIWSEQEKSAIEDIFESLFHKSGGSESREVGFLTYNVYTEEELREKATNEEGDFSITFFNTLKQTNQSEISAFTNYRGTGECSIWLVSEMVYEENFHDKEGFVKISDMLGATPQNAYDEYAIRLGDTAMYRYYDALRRMPADTLIVFSKAWIMGASSNEATYEEYKTLYQAMIGFEAP